MATYLGTYGNWIAIGCTVLAHVGYFALVIPA